MAYTTIDNPELYFQNKAYTGDGNSNQAITFDGSENMKPDWVWIKTRGAAHQHTLIDSTRGVNKALLSESNSTEDTDDQYGWLSSFNTNGFTTQDGSASDHWNVNKSGNTYISWNWVANGGTTSSDSNGSITSTVQANTTAGFSIVSYTGTGSNATVGHGLGSTPKILIVKNRDAAQNWLVYSSVLTGTSYLRLNLTNAKGTSSAVWNNTDPTSSVFTVGTDGAVNASSQNLIAYCFAEKKGYSKFGSYTGNGSSDGVYIHLGFSPSFIIAKRTDSSANWYMMTRKISDSGGGNPLDRPLFANDSQAENDGDNNVDFLSNGFKLRDSGSAQNGSGASYIYMAFAESPFVNSNGVPNNAR